MNKLKLVHTKDKFSLVIGDQEIKSVSSYKITADAKYPGHVDLELSLKLEVEDIEIENDNNLKDCQISNKKKSSNETSLDLKNLGISFTLLNKDEINNIALSLSRLIREIENLQIGVDPTSIQIVTDLKEALE